MKKVLAYILASAALASSGVALADRPGDDWIPIEKALEVAKNAGYTKVSEIEADDGQWEGSGYKQDGEEYSFKIDGKTGQVTKDEKEGLLR